MGSAAQGICNEAYFEYVEEAIPRRTPPIGKRSHLEIKNQPPPTSNINFTESPSLRKRFEYDSLGKKASSLIITWMVRSSSPLESSSILCACRLIRFTICVIRSATVPSGISNAVFLPINFESVGSPRDSTWIFNVHLQHLFDKGASRFRGDLRTNPSGLEKRPSGALGCRQIIYCL